MLPADNSLCVTRVMRLALFTAVLLLVVLPLAAGQHPLECIPTRCITHVRFTKPCQPSPSSASAICDGVILDFACIAPLSRYGQGCNESGIKRSAILSPRMDMSQFRLIPTKGCSVSGSKTGQSAGEC